MENQLVYIKLKKNLKTKQNFDSEKIKRKN